MRPKRLYKTKNGKYYYLVKGKKKYVKVSNTKDKGIIINIKNIIPPHKKPLRKRKKTVFAVNPKSLPRSGLPYDIPIIKKIIPTIEEIQNVDIQKREKIEKTKNDAEAEIKVKEKKNFKLIQDKIDEFNVSKDVSKDVSEDVSEDEDVSEPKDRISELKEIKPDRFVRSSIDYIYNNFLIKNKLKNKPESWNLFKKEPTYLKKIRKTRKTNKTNHPIIYYKYTPSFDSDEKDEDDEAGSGERGDDGLYNSEINDILKGLNFGPVPVIPSDKVEMLLDYVKPGMKKFGAIINTNPSSSDGSGTDGFRTGHWRSIFFDNDDDYVTAEYFDPLVEGQIPNNLKEIMKKIAKKINPEDYALFKQNALKRQANEASTCGYHSIKFIDDRMNSIPWSQATGYDSFMNKNKPDDSLDGEKSLVAPIKKYNKFI